MKLFMVYLGGRVSGCHIEMHDVRFVIGKQIEDCYQKLKAQWVGDRAAVHMDSYVEIKHADGYEVSLVKEKPAHNHKLFFVNLGAYVPERLAEQHDFALFVAKDAYEAKEKAKYSLLNGMTHLHKDNLHDVDDCFAIDLLDEQYFIALKPSGKSQPLTPDWFGYHIL
ncbi:hypothetical protein PSECIP111854_03141 [Pseudoalteromonas sp. CIP111854]|uniref:DUF1543 domain-containing protein n=1 Tax=Pseudoalteromonas holothuriae TaxID=2963714 RepID=A0A9W4R271_9GAMM|nr:DUF1543 domain-containing protein [Pseudoalteromonas sp. CIP111854]CAH9063021.1 hypothetical protein PSECIP111854_03141 [Pseudoalteromonas sp. CIP111854]